MTDSSSNRRLGTVDELQEMADSNDLGLEQEMAGPPLQQQVLRAIEEGERLPGDLRGISLAGQNLKCVDFSGCDLSKADFTGAVLGEAKFFKCNLRGAKLLRARLDGTEFLGSDLSGADLSECIGEQASFGHADLREARFFRARLTQSTFVEANLRQTDFRIADLRGANLQRADLSLSDFTRADLSDADASEADVFRASFARANLSRARLMSLRRFRKADWIGVDIDEMHLHGAYQLRRFIMDENYLHEFKTQGRWSHGLYWIWWVTSDCGRSFSRWAAWTAAVVVLFSLAYGFVPMDYGAQAPNWLTRVYYSVVTLTTLGYGDVLPASDPGKVLVIFEVVLGYLALGGLISIFANKMARRAD